jgi:hypothetical protein
MHSYISDEYFDFITKKTMDKETVGKVKNQKGRRRRGLNQ